MKKVDYVIMAGLLVFCLSGCSSESKVYLPLPPPEVQVTIHEDTESVWAELSMSYHGEKYVKGEAIPETKWANIKLNSLKELQRYRKQAEFLLLRLTEIEEKMRAKQPKKKGEGQ